MLKQQKIITNKITQILAFPGKNMALTFSFFAITDEQIISLEEMGLKPDKDQNACLLTITATATEQDTKEIIEQLISFARTSAVYIFLACGPNDEHLLSPIIQQFIASYFPDKLNGVVLEVCPPYHMELSAETQNKVHDLTRLMDDKYHLLLNQILIKYQEKPAPAAAPKLVDLLDSSSASTAVVELPPMLQEVLDEAENHNVLQAIYELNAALVDYAAINSTTDHSILKPILATFKAYSASLLNRQITKFVNKYSADELGGFIQQWCQNQIQIYQNAKTHLLMTSLNKVEEYTIFLARNLYYYRLLSHLQKIKFSLPLFIAHAKFLTTIQQAVISPDFLKLEQELQDQLPDFSSEIAHIIPFLSQVKSSTLVSYLLIQPPRSLYALVKYFNERTLGDINRSLLPTTVDQLEITLLKKLSICLHDRNILASIREELQQESAVTSPVTPPQPPHAHATKKQDRRVSEEDTLDSRFIKLTDLGLSLMPTQPTLPEISAEEIQPTASVTKNDRTLKPAEKKKRPPLINAALMRFTAKMRCEEQLKQAAEKTQELAAENRKHELELAAQRLILAAAQKKAISAIPEELVATLLNSFIVSIAKNTYSEHKSQIAEKRTLSKAEKLVAERKKIEEEEKRREQEAQQARAAFSAEKERREKAIAEKESALREKWALRDERQMRIRAAIAASSTPIIQLQPPRQRKKRAFVRLTEDEQENKTQNNSTL